MIRLSQIDEDFSIYKDNIFIVLGIGEGTLQLLELLNQNDIQLDYICNNTNKHQNEFLKNVPFVPAKELKKLCKNADKNKKIVVLLGTKKVDSKIESKLLSFGVDIVISYSESLNVLLYKNKCNFIKNNPIIKSQYANYKNMKKTKLRYNSNEFLTNNPIYKQFLFVCMLNRAGNDIIVETLKSNSINSCYFSNYYPESLDKEVLFNLKTTIKITTAVRDPLSQCISAMYGNFSAVTETDVIFDLDLINNPLFINGGDAQKEFDRFYNYNDERKNPVSNFMERFKECVIDLSQYEFDKEKGYTIVKKDNVEIFIYQLEKMNDIVKEMSDWIGATPFDEWVISNDANSKWVADSYKQAQKELQFTKEFFDKCYNNEWVEHFYSKEDIEKFKARWAGQVMD